MASFLDAALPIPASGTLKAAASVGDVTQPPQQASLTQDPAEQTNFISVKRLTLWYLAQLKGYVELCAWTANISFPVLSHPFTHPQLSPGLSSLPQDLLSLSDFDEQNPQKPNFHPEN